MIIGSSLPDIVARDVKGFKFQSDPNKPSDPAGQDQYNRSTIQVAFLAGVFYSLVGVLRLGFFTNFLSHSVISGFMTGAATLIGLTQLKFFFGYDQIKNKKWTPLSPKSVSFFFLPFFFPSFFSPSFPFPFILRGSPPQNAHSLSLLLLLSPPLLFSSLLFFSSRLSLSLFPSSSLSFSKPN